MRIFIIALAFFSFFAIEKFYAQTAEIHLKKGKESYEKEDYINALIEYNKAIEINPNYSRAYCGIGIIKAKKEQYKEAIIDYNKAIELNSKYINAYFNRGIAKKCLKN